ncbi:MAG TPA: SUMF1/EgtB/PvdO family nonheme iron enzyme [Terriglobales bacterium]|nr:SUMF1/EgtB/PvdO family nonheme iron enzyme [Terriglobales bacterium]
MLWPVVRPEALYRRPVPERHRLVFYLGHLEAFDWNLLAPVLDLKPFHAEWDKLFAFGIDPVEGELPSDPESAWPAIDEVRSYNREVRSQLDRALAQPITPEVELRLEVALEHRWMHVETLSYLFHNLPYEQKQSGPQPHAGAATPYPAAIVSIPTGTATLGQQRNGTFGWDNEFDAFSVPVPSFSIDKRKVSNGDYLKFVAAGAAPPHFWTMRDKQWMYRGMFGEVPLPLDLPVYVTHAEASAYADWRGQRLPTEAEWHRASEGATAGNAGLRHWDPIPVDPMTASTFGVQDTIGNGWEWTSTEFAPFPGFRPFEFYPGYSANFFDGKHFVLKGASPRTAACFLRPSFRNWFQPQYPYLYAGFRCVSR